MHGNEAPVAAPEGNFEPLDHELDDQEFQQLAKEQGLYDALPDADEISQLLFIPTSSSRNLERAYNGEYRGWYGERWCPPQSKFGGRGGKHRGADIFVLTGTELVAIVGPAQLRWNPGNSSGTWGNHIFLSFRWNDGNNYTFVYAHLERLIGTSPRTVKVGEVICRSDCTGNAGGPGMFCGTPNSKGGMSDHVHLELWKGSPGGTDTRIDPIAWLNWNLKYANDSTCR